MTFLNFNDFFRPFSITFPWLSMTRFFLDCGNPEIKRTYFPVQKRRSSSIAIIIYKVKRFWSRETMWPVMSCLDCLTHIWWNLLRTLCFLWNVCNERRSLLALLGLLTGFFLLQLFVSTFLSHRFPDVASLVAFLYCLVCLREILLDKKFETWPKLRVVTAPGLKFRAVSRPPWPRFAARLSTPPPSHIPRI